MSTYYVSPTGNSGNPGTQLSPWSASHALLSSNATLQAGDVVLWLPGTYDLGTFTATKSGTLANPILHKRAISTEFTSIEGSITLNGANVWFQDFDICWSGTESRGPFPDETQTVRWTKNFTPNAENIRFIQCRMHNMKDGVFAGNAAINFILDECITYNQGLDGDTRGHGHAIYLQNDTGTKRVRNHIAWGGYQFGLQVFGTSAASLRNIIMEDSAIFQPGVSTSYNFPRGAATVIVNGGVDGSLGPVTVDNCSLFRQTTDGNSRVARLGLDGFGTGLAIRNSILRGSMEIAPNLNTIFTDNLLWVEDNAGNAAAQPILCTLPDGQPDSIHTIDRNSYFLNSPLGTTFNLTAWRSRGYDINGSLTTSNPIGSISRAFPSRYTQGRGHIHVWNFSGSSSVAVNIGPAVNYLTGIPFRIYHVFDFVSGGQPLVSGIYDGSLVTIPMDARTPPRPYGATQDPPTMPNTFGVFVVTLRPDYLVSYSRGL